MRSFSDATSRVIVNQFFIKNWRKHFVAQAMLYHSVTVM